MILSFSNAINMCFTARWLVSSALALLVTILLVTLMHSLIRSEPVVTEPTYTQPPIDVVMPKRVIENQEIVPPNKPEKVEPEPITPRLVQTEITQKAPVLTGFSHAPKASFRGTPVADSGRFPIARIMVAPEYPYRAAQKNIEGYVDITFDITVAGIPSNIQVTAAKPEKIFNAAALKAIKRWRFMPYEQDGEAVPFYGMAKRLVFDLEE